MKNIILTIDVQHNIICKMSSLKRKKSIDILKIVENKIPNLWKTIYYLNLWVIITNTTKGVLYILIPQLLNILRIQFEII